MMASFFRFVRIFTASALILGADHALGCSLKPGWHESEFNNAKYVFTALVTKAEVRDVVDPILEGYTSQPLGYVHAEYELIEALKGTPSEEGSVVTISWIFGVCGGVPIVVGDKYLFYASEIQSNDDFPEDLKRQMAPSDLWLFTASSVSFRESHAQEMLATTRAIAKSQK